MDERLLKSSPNNNEGEDKKTETIKVDGFGEFEVSAEGLKALALQAQEAQANQKRIADKAKTLEDQIETQKLELERLHTPTPEINEDETLAFLDEFNENPDKTLGKWGKKFLDKVIIPTFHRELEPLRRGATLKEMREMEKIEGFKEDRDKVAKLGEEINAPALLDFLRIKGYDIDGLTATQLSYLIHAFASGKINSEGKPIPKIESPSRRTSVSRTAEEKLREILTQDEYATLQETLKKLEKMGTKMTSEEYLKLREEANTRKLAKK